MNECEKELVDAKLDELVESNVSVEKINCEDTGDDFNSEATLREANESRKVEGESTRKILSELREDTSNKSEDKLHNFDYLTDFLNHERRIALVVKKSPENCNSDSFPSCDFTPKTVAPLPSPENIPWKQLPFSKLTYKEVVTNCENNTNEEKHSTKLQHEINEADYVDINNLENEKLSVEFAVLDQSETLNIMDDREYSNGDWGIKEGVNVLGDIRFTGPCNTQLMSTSFSESNDLGEEQGWDSGSDTRSSSSGEFIWKVRIFNLMYVK